MTSVLHVVVAGEIGGAERMLVDLARGSKARHAVALFTPSAALRGFLRGAGLDLVDRGSVREDPASYLWRSLGPADTRWLAETMRRAGARVAHLHTFASQMLGTRAARRAGLRVLRTEHSTRVYDDPSCWPFSRWSLRRVDRAVAISEDVRAVALAKAPWAADKMIVIRNGVDVARFAPREEPRAPGPPRLVLVGRLEPRKGVDVAIVALSLVPDATLEIVGDGEERAELERLARARGVEARVRFLGYMEDTRDALARADAALCSSRKEGLGIALLEAMAMGKPVIAVPVGGVPEIVRAGETGWLASSASPEALASALREALRDANELATRGQAARAFVRGELSVEAMRDRYDAEYEHLANL